MGKYEIKLNENDALRQTIQYGGEYILYLKSNITVNNAIEQEMVLSLGTLSSMVRNEYQLPIMDKVNEVIVLLKR